MDGGSIIDDGQTGGLPSVPVASRTTVTGMRQEVEKAISEQIGGTGEQRDKALEGSGLEKEHRDNVPGERSGPEDPAAGDQNSLRSENSGLASPLYKKGGCFLCKKWTKQYFALDKTGRLSYSSTPSNSKAEESVQIDSDTVIEDNGSIVYKGGKNLYVFVVRTKNRKFTLAGESLNCKLKWTGALAKAKETLRSDLKMESHPESRGE